MAAKSDGAAVCLTENESESRWLVGPDQRPAPHCRAENRYTLLDCCWVLCALLVFFSDGATDLWLAADYYLRGDFWWFGLTLVFVVVPSAVVQVLSFRWFVYDYSEMNDSSREEAAARGGGGDSNFSTKGSGQRGSGSAVGVRPLPAQSSRGRTLRCCRVCMWVFQTVIHILQLGQVWR
uniref:XK-related protein n=2 Tax=Electrophorus electricus TaxID=8005 RepID=A0A4W4FW79_ELEEL